MVRTQRPWLAWVTGVVLLLVTSGAQAIYLDEDQNVTLRARIYSQAAIRIDNSQVDTVPTTKAGQLIQNRFYGNPELDAKLAPYTNWLRGGAFDWLAPDDLRFRIAAWAFYDGIYDYGSAQFNQSQKLINSTFNAAVPCNNPTPSGCADIRQRGWFVSGPNIKLSTDPTNFNQVFPGFEEYVPRSIYGNSARVNELYLSYTKGPFFLRFGRQSISWGESDTIALLDQSNPFDLTLAAPGFFEDIDEARIPLYTARASYNLFDTLGPLSSGFVESYWVPGNLDATTAITPLLTASPYSPRGRDPQQTAFGPGRVFPPTFQFLFFDHTLKQDFGSSRWGFRFQTVVNRFLTAQAWAYRTFPTSPVPVHVGFAQREVAGIPIPPPALQIDDTNFYAVSLEHKPVMVYGLAGTFFFEPLDGIVRLNAQLFEHEAGFIPLKNLRICQLNKFSPPNPACLPRSTANPKGLSLSMLTSRGSIPYSDVLRYEIGFDRFFFLRFLNPTNSFILSASAVGSYNSSWTDTSSTDFRFGGQLKPGLVCRGPESCPPAQLQSRGSFQQDFIQGYKLDAQFQTTFQTDYMHGRLQPRLTLIQFVRGTFATHATLVYRWNDWMLFQTDFQFITGAYQSLGFFRDRSQVSFRVTYQLN
jgi:hypothetical protein